MLQDFQYDRGVGCSEDPSNCDSMGPKNDDSRSPIKLYTNGPENGDSKCPEIDDTKGLEDIHKKILKVFLKM
ncbi:hypothetical protein Bpfe_004531, partial [Biomphalaria pfeifferi]